MIEAGGCAPCKHSVFASPGADGLEIWRRWIAVMGRSGAGRVLDQAGVCEEHFLTEDSSQETSGKTDRQPKFIKPDDSLFVFDFVDYPSSLKFFIF